MRMTTDTEVKPEKKKLSPTYIKEEFLVLEMTCASCAERYQGVHIGFTMTGLFPVVNE